MFHKVTGYIDDDDNDDDDDDDDDENEYQALVPFN